VPTVLLLLRLHGEPELMAAVPTAVPPLEFRQQHVVFHAGVVPLMIGVLIDLAHLSGMAQIRCRIHRCVVVPLGGKFPLLVPIDFLLDFLAHWVSLT
jgi:hypothetical protein